MRNLQYEMKICQKSHNELWSHKDSLCMIRIFMNQTLVTVKKTEFLGKARGAIALTT